MAKTTKHGDTLHLRLDSVLKAQIDEAAQSKRISSAGFVRMALVEYLARHGSPVVQESASGYTAPKSPPEAPPVKHRCAVKPSPVNWDFFAIYRPKS